MEFGVSGPLQIDLRRGGFESKDVLGAEFDIGRPEVLFEPRRLRCPRDGDDPWPLRQQPGERNLGRRSLLLLRERGQKIDQGLVGLSILCVEARDGAAKVRTVELRVRINLPGEEALSQRTERDESDAEFLECGQNRLFRFSPPQ